MALHPQVQTMLEAMQADPNRKETHELSPDEAREGYRLLGEMMGAGPEIAAVADRNVPGPAGDIPVRVYTPAGSGPRGLIVYYHGGGWVIGDLDTHDKECRLLCAEADCVVVAVHYRLAPEHPFPAAVDDATAAYRWVCEHAAELGADPARIAVAGDSAGGNLSAVVAQWARDHGVTLPLLQILVYPAVDLREGTEYPSMTENADGPFLLAETMKYFRDHYVGGTNADLADPRLSPLFGSLEGLPPALILTAEHDPLRDEGEVYARALEDAGVEVSLRRYDGMPHAFFHMSTVLPAGREAMDDCVSALRAALA